MFVKTPGLQTGMGLYERDYIRDDPETSWGEWLERRGVFVLIGIACAVFFLQLMTLPKTEAVTSEELRKLPQAEQRAEHYDPVRRSADLHPPSILKGEVWRFFTAFWVHDMRQVVSFIFGMLIIYMIGRQLEPVFGGQELIVFFLYAGLATMGLMFLGKVLAKYVFAGAVFWPFDFELASCGVGGPVAAIVMFFGLKFWDQPMRITAETTVPTWGLVAVCFGLSFTMKLTVPERAELIMTDLSGILAAWIYHKMGWRLSERFQTMGQSMTRRPATRLKIAVTSEPDDDDKTELEPVRPIVTKKRADAVDEQLEAKLDRVLDKVAKTGRDSLTEDEQSVLLRASEVYRKKRGQ